MKAVDDDTGLEREPPVEQAGPTAGTTGDEFVSSWWVRWLLIAAAIVPFVTAALRAIANDWFPIGDSALLYLRAADVGTNHHPWLGSWSSASISLDTNINNPGPIYADLIAPFAHVFSPGVGNVIGVTLVNVGCLVGAAVAARRIGGWRFERWVLVAAAGLAWAMGSELLFDIFQAHALLFPFLLMFVLVVGVLTGAAWPWPWLVAVTSVILQTHISYAYIAVVLLGTMLVVVVHEAEAPRWHAVRMAVVSPTAGWSVGVGVVLWAQPAIEQLFGEGQGNMARLVSNARGTDINVGIANATKIVAAIVSLPPWWTRPGFSDTVEPRPPVDVEGDLVVEIPGLPSGALALFALVATIALLLWCNHRARGRGDRALAALALLSIAGIAGGVVALSRLTVGPVGLAPHHTRWVFVIALFAHLTLVWAAVEWLVPQLTSRLHGARGDDTTIVTALLVVMLSVSNLQMYAQQHGPTDDAHTMPAMRQLFPPLDTLRRHQPVLYRSDNLRLFEPYSSAVMLQLEARGIEFRVDDEILVRQLGTGRRADGSEMAALAQYEGWQVMSGDLPGCVLVRASRFEPIDDAAFETVAQAFADRIAAAIGRGEMDAAGVLIAAGADDAERDLAERFNAGDPLAVREAVYEGRLSAWIDQGWAAGTADLIGELAAEGPAITEWLDSVVALAVTPADVCDG
jgi:hypothetical protein